jgi:hypothetical protein
MKGRIAVIFAASMLLLVSNCCKDKTAYTRYCFQQGDNPLLQPAFIRKDTANFGVCESAIGEQTLYSHTYPIKACINPNNPNQLCYILYYGSPEYTTKLRFMDMCTGEDRLISDIALSFPSWSKKNWITFSAKDHQLYKVKPSGDSLTQLTFEGEYNVGAVWNHEGSQLFFVRTTGSKTYAIIADETGLATDTLQEYIGAHDWNRDNRLACLFREGSTYPYYVGVAYYDLEQKQLHKIKGWHDYGNLNIDERSPDAVRFSEDGNFLYWSNLYTVNKLNINTGENTRLYSVPVPLPSNELLTLYSVINDNYLLLNTSNGYFIDTCKIRYLTHLNIMDAKRTNEQKFIQTQ